MDDTTPLDREWWSNLRCELKCGRKSQLTIDETPHNKHGGLYHHFCWQCYWGKDAWRLGPIVNCGPAWDVVDVRRDLNERKADFSPS